MAESKNWNLAVSNEKINEEVSRFIAQESGIKNRLLLASVKSHKLENALSVHHLEKDEYPIFFYDDTLLCGGKDGFLITNKNVYVHEMFEESKKIAISELKTITNHGNSILFNSIRAPVSWIECEKMEGFLKSILIKKTEPKKSASAKKTSENKAKNEEKQAEKSSAEKIEFKGFLHNTYGIGKGMLIGEAISHLEENGWTISPKKENEDYPESHIFMAMPPKKAMGLWFPLMLAKYDDRKDGNNENVEKLVGITHLFFDEDEEKIEKVVMKECKKYGFKEKHDENIDMDVWTKPAKGNKIDYANAIFFGSDENWISVTSFLHEEIDKNPLYYQILQSVTNEDDIEDGVSGDDEESKTTGKTKKRRNRTPKSPTFEGLLYDDYGIKRDMLVNDAITILKNEGWQIVENDDVEPNITTLVPSGETTLYGLPLSGIALAECYLPPENFRSLKEEENEGKLAGIVCYFPQSVEKKLSNFMEKEFIQRYGLKRKDNDEIGLPVYAKLQEEKFLGLDISSEIDYARALVIDNSFSDYVLVYSFFSESRYANPFFSTLRKEWSDTLVQQTDDDAKMMYNYRTVGVSEFYDETPNEEFTKLLDKWEDILQRDDIKIDVRNPKDRYSGTDASMIHTYKTILEYYSPQKDARLNLEFGRNSSRECFLHLYYSKGKHQIEGGVSMRYEYSTSLTDFAIKAKLCLDSLLAHIGRTDLAKLVAKFQAKKDAEDAERKRKEEELEKQKWEQEWEQEQREQDEFEDDFDNL
ncbi:MAG: hypothetical protein IJ158_12240 [Treponema sp.]|nr:hypothetical protein [Treponema sp.]